MDTQDRDAYYTNVGKKVTGKKVTEKKSQEKSHNIYFLHEIGSSHTCINNKNIPNLYFFYGNGHKAAHIYEYIGKHSQ